MYLKRLDIHGFKSFASPTSLEFGVGITCVAGPNGAGKTNVADAIRWVLGEQASRVIRARKTEDVIFSGSAKRAALGMAEVKITLDNSDHWLPVDFDEVVVSRRAYRSGENEYYVNAARVRLRDVNELFMKAQVGQNSYAFMGQGLVEQVLTLRPDERRGMIEEAADVRLHRDRLNDARSKLSATRDNLDRVRMLVSEIVPRLRQLERQADRAQSYAQLSGDLSLTLRELYGEQWKQAHEAIAGAQSVLDQRKEAFDAAQRQAQSLEEGASSLGQMIDQQRHEASTMETSLLEKQEYTRELQRRITLDEERVLMISARLAEMEGEKVAALEDRAQVEALMNQLSERVRAIEVQAEAARAPDTGIAEADEIDMRLHEVRAELSQSEYRASQAQTRLGEAEGLTAAIGAQHDRLTKELANLEQTRQDPLGALRQWAAEFASLRRNVNELRPQAEHAVAALKAAEAQRNEVTASIAAKQQESERLRIEIEAGQARYELAQGVDAELPPPDAGVRAVLTAGGRVPDAQPHADHRIDGVVGMLGQVLRVPSGLERAVEAALADSLHAIVVERQEDALAAVELLISEDAGRATILSLRDVEPTPPINILDERGVLGVASDLVRCDGKFRALVNTLLGRTIVVQNLGIAKAVLRRGMGNVVTLDGILLRRNGAMTAGSSRAIRAALVHQREVSELPVELEAARSARIDVERAIDTEERSLAEVTKECERAEPESQRLQGELAAVEERLAHHQSRLAALTGRLVALRIHRTEVQQGLATTEPELSAARASLGNAQQTLTEHDTQRARLREQLNDLMERREKAASKLAGQTTRIAALDDELRSLEQQRRVQDSAIRRIDQEVARRDQVSAQIQRDLEAIRTRLDSNREEWSQRLLDLEAAQNELAPARNALDQFISRQRTIGDELGAARSLLLSTERSLLEAEAELRGRTDELQALRSKMEEEGFRPSDEGGLTSTDSEQADAPPDWLRGSEQGDGAVPPMRGGAEVDVSALRERATELRNRIRRLGPVNEQAGEDYAENKERHDFLTAQIADLSEAEHSLNEAIDELERIIRERFSATFQMVGREFSRYFSTFFNGGHGELQLTRPDEQGLPGIDIIAQPPRKRVRSLAMLSGGERSLTALALLFALLNTNPSPICVLDEVDAALDESNVDRFSAVLRELSERTQFITITHNRRTLEIADTIYGVSMGEDSVSTLLSLRLSDISKN